MSSLADLQLAVAAVYSNIPPDEKTMSAVSFLNINMRPDSCFIRDPRGALNLYDLRARETVATPDILSFFYSGRFSRVLKFTYCEFFEILTSVVSERHVFEFEYSKLIRRAITDHLDTEKRFSELNRDPGIGFSTLFSMLDEIDGQKKDWKDLCKKHESYVQEKGWCSGATKSQT